MPIKKQPPISNQASGFTLLELSVVIVISIILTMMIVKFLDSYNEQIKHEETKQAVANANAAIAKFYDLAKRYPCPADKSLMPGDANYGHEDCSLATIDGARDTNLANGLSDDQVYVGMFPMYATVGTGASAYTVTLPELAEDNEIMNNNVTDAWGNIPQYAVTQVLTRPYVQANHNTTFDPYRGSIRIIDEHGNNTGGTKEDAHYVVLSYGHDGMGAKNWANGNIGTQNTDFANQAENFDNDAVFVSSIRNSASLTAADKNRFFDDYVAFTTTTPMTLWSKDGANGVSTVTSHNVGIGTAKPVEKLTIGNITASDAETKSSLKVERTMYSQGICDAGTTNCFTPQSLIDLKCTAPGQYMKSVKIVNGKLMPDCQNIALTTPVCPNNGYLQGVDTAGNPICTDPAPIRIESQWKNTNSEGNSASLTNECVALGQGWKSSHITDNSDDPLHSLGEKTPSAAVKSQLCLRTTDAKVVLTSAWSTGSCPSNTHDTGIRDNSGSDIHNVTEADTSANTSAKWCLGVSGKGVTMSVRWASSNTKYPSCNTDEVPIINTRSGDKNMNSITLSGSYDTLCAKLNIP